MNLYEAIKNNIHVDYDNDDVGELEECITKLKVSTYYDTKDIKDFNLQMELAEKYDFTDVEQIDELVEYSMSKSLFKQYKKETSKLKSLTEKKKATIKFLKDAISALEQEEV